MAETPEIEAMDDSPAPAPRGTGRARLIGLSLLMLFVELALIRWTGSNVVYLSYFSNFVLLGSFLGIGVGFLRSHSRVNLWPWAPLALTLLVAFVFVFPVKIDRSGADIIYFGELHKTGFPPAVTLPIIFLVVAITMAMIAEGVGRTFARFEPLEAYRLDILGSILGILLFSALSLIGAPPVAWGIVVAALFGVLLGDRMSWATVAALIVMLVLLTIESAQSFTLWSPYYKISVHPAPNDTFRIDVNGIPHQSVASVEHRRASEPHYFVPYDMVAAGSLEDVLIVGAGNGSDVAIALSKGAGSVDAVEIDPRLLELGERLNPDDPYSNPRVHAVIDDGRAYLQGTDKRYDLILFALPDSLTLVSGQSSLRLESYLFTREAMTSAREHLKPNGVFSMYNYYREGWLVDRLAHTLGEVYGHPPCVSRVNFFGLAVLTVGREAVSVQCDALALQDPVGAPPPATDDYPFLYLKERGIPGLYLVAIALILATSIILVRLAAGRLSAMRTYADLFFMGAAFLLLETKNVVQFALLFGTTWFVNALVFLGILVSVYLAIELSMRWRPRRPLLLYYALLASLIVAYAIPVESLLQLGFGPRFVAATLLAFAPVFTANLVFSQRFRDVGSSTTAFGANLLGAMVGGVLEYGALLVGYRALLIVAAVLYGFAFLAGRHHLRAVTA